jgi:post-segregation antitoxin (ccd killing protein)
MCHLWEPPQTYIRASGLVTEDIHKAKKRSSTTCWLDEQRAPYNEQVALVRVSTKQCDMPPWFSG